MQREGRSQSPHRNYCLLNQIPRCWYERIHYALQKYYILMIYQSILNKMYSI